MKFAVYTEEQLNTLMPDGEYDAEVIEFHSRDQAGNIIMSKEKTGPNGEKVPGNPMTKVKVQVWDKVGELHTLQDFLVDLKTMAYKTRHFCAATGTLDKYEAGQEIKGIDVLGKNIKVKIGRQEEQEIHGKTYAARNVIKDYIKPLQLVKHQSDALPFDDDIKL